MVGTRKRRPGERTGPEEEKPVTREEDGEEVITQKREACRVIDQVKVLIEECLMQYMNKEEVLNDLCTRKGVDRGITETVWEKLVQDNSEFFQQYYAKTMLKKQILCYKYVLEKQVRLMHERFQSAAASSTLQSQPENTMRHGSNSAGTSYMVGMNNQQSPMIHDEFPALASTHVGQYASVPTARVPRATALEEVTGTARVSDNGYMNNLGSGFPEGNLLGRPSFTGYMQDASFNPELVGQHYNKQFLDANISSGYSCQGSESAGGIPPPHVTQFASASASTANYQPCAQNPENMITHGGIFTHLAPAHMMGNSAGMQASENPFGGMLHEVVGGGTMSSPCYPSSFDFGDAAVPESAMEASAPMLRSEPPNTGMLLHEPGGRGGFMSAPFDSSSSGFAIGEENPGRMPASDHWNTELPAELMGRENTYWSASNPSSLQQLQRAGQPAAAHPPSAFMHRNIMMRTLQSFQGSSGGGATVSALEMSCLADLHEVDHSQLSSTSLSGSLCHTRQRRRPKIFYLLLRNICFAPNVASFHILLDELENLKRWSSWSAFIFLQVVQVNVCFRFDKDEEETYLYDQP